MPLLAKSVLKARRSPKEIQMANQTKDEKRASGAQEPSILSSLVEAAISVNDFLNRLGYTLSVVQEQVGPLFEKFREAARLLEEQGFVDLFVAEKPETEDIIRICQRTGAHLDCPYKKSCFSNSKVPLPDLLQQNKEGCSWTRLRSLLIIRTLLEESETFALVAFSEETTRYAGSKTAEADEKVRSRIRDKIAQMPLTDQYVLYAPRLTRCVHGIASEIEKEHAEYVLRDAQFIMPAKEYSEMFGILKAQGPGAMWQALAAWYRDNDLFDDFFQRVDASSLDANRKQILKDAAQAHRDGLYTLSVPVLLAQWEGITAEKEGRVGDRLHNYVGTLSDSFAREMQQLYIGHGSFRGDVLHGRKTDYASEEHSIRIVFPIHLKL